MSIVPSGSPPPYLLATSWPRIVPTVRLTLRMAKWRPHRLAPVQGVGGKRDQLVVERLVEAVVLLLGAAQGVPSWGTCRIGDRSSPPAFQWSTTALIVERLGVADRLLDAAEPEVAQVLAHLLRDVLEEVDDERLAGEALAQHGVLRGHADRQVEGRRPAS